MARATNIKMPDLSGLNLQIKVEGNWNRLDQLSGNLTRAINIGYEAGIDEFSNKLLKIVRRSLTTGTPPRGSGVSWAPHSPATIKRYGSHDLYNLTGTYASSVGLFRYKSRTYVGLQHNKKKSSQGNLTLGQLSKILEFGSDKIPARPVWAPSLLAAGGKVGIKNIIMRNIRSKLISMCGVNARQVR